MAADDVTLDSLVRVARAPRAPAIVSGHRTLTYEQLATCVDRAARYLVEHGVAPGDRVLVILPSSIEYLVAILAISSAGGIAVPLPPSSGVERTGLVVTATAPRLCIHAGDASAVGVAGWAIDLEALAPSRTRLPAGRTDATAMVLFSSGSTGVPKGITLTHRQLLTTADYLRTSYGIAPGHRELVIAPMCHSDGWQRTSATLLAGGCVCIAAGMLSIQGVLEDVRRFEIAGFFIPPSLVRFLLRAERSAVVAALRSVRTIEIGSAPVSADELREIAGLAPHANVFVHYGLTECSRAVILDVNRSPDKLATVGRPGRDVELAIVTDDHREAGPGELGEIWLRGPQMSRRYWQRPDLDVARHVSGWLVTGDYGTRDSDGFVTLAGRRDDMISCAGFHFFPADIELEIGPVAGVATYLCAGVPDPVLGEVPWAFLVADAPAVSPVHRFLAQARRRLPPHMVPRRAVLIPDVPLLPSGKPDRRRTIELYGAP